MHRTSRRRLARIAAAVTAATLLLAGCSKTNASSDSGSGGGSSAAPIAKDDLVLVASVINTTNPYMASMIEGAKALSAKLGVPLEVVDSQGSSQTEISKIQAILARGKKAVVMVNTVASSDAKPIVDAVKQAGGYVTIWWNKPDNLEPWDVGNNFVAFQKYSGVESGECTGKALAESLGGKGNVVGLAGVLDSTTSQTRVAGFKNALKAYPNIKLLDLQPANWDPQLGLSVTQNLLTKYPNQIDGIWAADDAMIIGATQATKKANVYDKIKYVSDGLYPDVVSLMKQPNSPVVGETFHRGFMAASIGLYTAYLAATGKIDPSTLPHEKRDSLFKLVCATPKDFEQYTKWDNDVAGWVDTLVNAKDPWSVEPTPLVGQGPEKLPS
ncbi:sugar ABC transporter substrate-binding protein [Nakamurella endophytica]|uniref:Ribose ABC transporter ribose-binding protein n=1 Tax=Nakamurella endophytica TaxID=1748367 RepID=A0A917SW94_9ACTN|nr:sugar ABC transporter substrate-binding protein [Nakamurella endophytica]GGM00758.1 ribose ABC transporter ribose-binding protein [Nakamurella endophytica]